MPKTLGKRKQLLTPILLACPFCGGRSVGNHDDDDDDFTAASCSTCRASGPMIEGDSQMKEPDSRRRAYL